MSNYMTDALPAADLSDGAWRAIVATSASDTDDKVEVVIPDFDRELRWGPCRWMQRDITSRPERGDLCLVLFDNRNEPWVIAWWPFGDN